MRETLENNYSLKAAAAKVLQAQAALTEIHGRRLPDISYNLNRDRSKRSFNFGGFAGGGRFTVMTTTWSPSIAIYYLWRLTSVDSLTRALVLAVPPRREKKMGVQV